MSKEIYIITHGRSDGVRTYHVLSSTKPTEEEVIRHVLEAYKPLGYEPVHIELVESRSSMKDLDLLTGRQQPPKPRVVYTRQAEEFVWGLYGRGGSCEADFQLADGLELWKYRLSPEQEDEVDE